MQDIHRLRGISHLTEFEKRMFARALGEHMEAEYKPKDPPTSD